MSKFSDHEKVNATNIRKVAKSSKYKNIFFLGPYAKRVSFASQQNRALNLVWALDGLGDLKPSSNIAVIGGGLSGLTTCVALEELGHTVYLYEAGRVVLHRQLSSKHRFIHPTVNSWPEIKPTPTTEFPYFDWISDICGDLMKLISNEWDERITVKKNSILPVLHTHVEDFVETDQNVALITKESDPHATIRYNTVIVTSGFTDEKINNVKGINTYWNSAELDVDVNSGVYDKFLVSGCGDGGLIDALRIAHKNFDSGRLIVLAAELLAKNKKWKYAKKIIEAELSYEEENELDNASKNGSKDLQDLYFEAAANLPKPLQHILGGRSKSNKRMKTQPGHSQSLRDDIPNFVTLITTEKYPFSPLAAPIHKLLIAHAMNNHVVAHLHGKVMDDYKIDRLNYTPLAEHSPATKKPKELLGRVVIRHGARPNFDQFFKDNLAISNKLVKAQKMLAADLDKPLWCAGSNPLKEWPPTNKPYSRHELLRRLKHAIKILTMNEISERLYVSTDIGYYINYDEDSHHVSKLDLLPEKLFGFPFNKYGPDENLPVQTRVQGKKQSAEYSGHFNMQAGAIIGAKLKGRLGPILKDNLGNYYGTSVGHVLLSTKKKKLPQVYNANYQEIGRLLDTSVKFGGKTFGENICLFSIDAKFGVTSNYCGETNIKEPVPEDELFGLRVLLERINGEESKGFISATGAVATFFHPSLKRDVIFRNAIRVTPIDSNYPFSEDGDSGTPVLDEVGRLVGLVVSGNDKHTFVISMTDFLQENQLEIISKGDNKDPIDASESEQSEETQAFGQIIWDFTEFSRKTLAEAPLELGNLPSSKNDEG